MIFGRRRRLGLVPGEPSVFLEHGELHLVFGQFRVEEAFLLPDLLILHALLFYLLRRQHVLFNGGWRRSVERSGSKKAPSQEALRARVERRIGYKGTRTNWRCCIVCVGSKVSR